ncbi:hypothetical protein ACQCVE_08295 [Metabacillus sp. 113a]|uniref:hypothetical protein n=1 Tax=Metabacillus sp. 113a TaxID=3404706 RepID=UPI003CEFFE53
MKKMKIALVFGAGIVAGGVFMPIASSSASSNLVLASVEWVTSQLTPLNNRVANLEKEIKNLENSNVKPSLPSTIYVKTPVGDILRGAMEHYSTLTSAPMGQALTVKDQFISSDGRYFLVTYNGKTGYIADWEVSTSAVKKPTSFVASKTAPVLRGADSSYRQKGIVNAGQTVQYLNTFKNSSTGEVWIHVKLPNGVDGCVKLSNGEVR